MELVLVTVLGTLFNFSTALADGATPTCSRFIREPVLLMKLDKQPLVDSSGETSRIRLEGTLEVCTPPGEQVSWTALIGKEESANVLAVEYVVDDVKLRYGFPVLTLFVTSDSDENIILKKKILIDNRGQFLVEFDLPNSVVNKTLGFSVSSERRTYRGVEIMSEMSDRRQKVISNSIYLQ